jgi:eukaryotic-like serine/threonine-protein kinase
MRITRAGANEKLKSLSFTPTDNGYARKFWRNSWLMKNLENLETGRESDTILRSRTSISVLETIGHYRIQSKIGEGGMGAVYRAVDSKLNREVAVKVLPDTFANNPDRLARFNREAQLLATLNHPNIAAIYGIEDRALVLELVEGPTLADRIAQGPVPLDEALAIVRQIGQALEAAHERGIVHRDLKPANIKITADGTVKVLDFGLAKATDASPASSVVSPTISPTLSLEMTQAGMILGTAAYMSPEQAKGKTVDKRCDIWAFGVVLFEMLSGERLFASETVPETLAAVLTKEPDWNHVPTEVRRLLQRCLAKDPRARLRDIGDAWDLLETPASPAVSRNVQSTRSHWIWMAAAAVFAITASALAFLHFREVLPQARAIRFSVAAPEKTTFGPWLALSPDGRYLAFTASGSDRVTRVYLRALDSLETRVLAGTDGASGNGLLWSPDSRFLVFHAGKVKKIDITGGPSQPLCDLAGTTLGGSWSPHGDILLGQNVGPVVRVSADGTPTPVTRLDASRGDSFHSDPLLLSDGRRFLYFRHAEPQYQGLYAGSLDTKPEAQNLQRIMPLDFSPGYVPPQGGETLGHLFFLREGTLVEQSFDERSLEVVGEPIPLAERIATSFSRATFSVSKAGVLAWHKGGDIGRRQMAWVDRDGRQLGNAGEPGGFQQMELSPDDAHLAYVENTAGAGTNIWILDLARNARNRFTFENGSRLPVWSPDGKYIAYSVLGGGIYIKDSSNSANAIQVYREDLQAGAVQWSPDGRYLLFSRSFHRADVWALADPLSDRRKAIPLLESEFSETGARVSPDSRWLAYQSDESGRTEIYVRPFPPGDGRSGKWLVSTGDGIRPLWRGDGKELYYGSGSTIMAVDIRTEPAFQSGTPHALFRVSAFSPAFEFNVSRDGKRFLLPTLVSSDASEPVTVLVNWMAAFDIK